MENTKYIKEFVLELAGPQRHEVYKIAQKHFDKAIYLLQKATGIYITPELAEKFAENYAATRAYNYIGATVYNIPWYLIYSYQGFSLHNMLIRKDSITYDHLVKVNAEMEDSDMENYVRVKSDNYVLTATDYRETDENDEWLDFSVLIPNEAVKETRLYKAIDRFSINVNLYYFENLIGDESWKPQEKMLNIAKKYMNP